jgi:channel protein (hemolysin III family)
LASEAFLGIADPFSAATHLAGAAATLVAGIALALRRYQHWGHRLAALVFPLACVFLLSMSGVYHILPEGTRAREVLQMLDHAAIFALIAATFTPIHTIVFRGAWRWGMLAVVWGVAIVATGLKSVYFEQTPEWLGLALYLGLGWLGAVSGTLLWRRLGFDFIRPLLWGALAYTFGALVDYAEFPTILPAVIGPHELFHIAVLAGIAWHWQFILSVAGRHTVIGYAAEGEKATATA